MNMLVKEKLQEIISGIKDEKKIQSYYTLISHLEDMQEGNLYKSLTDQQKDILESTYNKSFDCDQLLDHDEVKSNFSAWL